MLRVRLVTLAMALLLGGAIAQTTIENVEELMAAFATGGEYRIAPGTYAVAETLSLSASLSIVGSDPAEVTIAASGGPIAVRVGEGARLHLEGLRLVWDDVTPGDLIVVRHGHVSLRRVDLGMAQAGTVEARDPWRDSHGTALVLQGTASAVVEDARIARNANAAIEMLSSSTLSLEGSIVIDNHRGLIAVAEASLDVIDTAIVDQVAQGLVLAGTVQATFTDTVFAGNGRLDVERGLWLEAIRLVERSRATFVGGVLRDSPTNGIAASDSAEAVIDGMLIEANGGVIDGGNRSWSALFVTSDARVAVQRSMVRGNPAGAFDVRGAGTLVIEDAVVFENGGFGHTAARDQAVLVVQGSRVVANDGAVLVLGEARVVISESELVDGGSSGVVASESAQVRVQASTVAGHAERGLWIDGDATVDVVDCDVEGNAMGLWLTGAATAFVIESRIRDNRHSGAVLLGTSRGAFTDNEIVGNAQNGVALAESSGGVLEGNLLAGNGSVGVLLVDAATGSLERNTITGSPAGVRLEDQATAQGADNLFADNEQDVAEVR